MRGVVHVFCKLFVRGVTFPFVPQAAFSAPLSDIFSSYLLEENIFLILAVILLPSASVEVNHETSFDNVHMHIFFQALFSCDGFFYDNFSDLILKEKRLCNLSLFQARACEVNVECALLKASAILLNVCIIYIFFSVRLNCFLVHEILDLKMTLFLLF